MADAVYLHIGVPKSGTTYLQGILWNNGDRLRELGYSLGAHSHQDVLRAMFDLLQRRSGPRIIGAWERLAANVRSVDGRVVISQEQLCRATSEHAAIAVKSVEPARTNVVITVRDLARQITSYWQEQVKARYTGTLSDMADVIISRQVTHDDFWAHQDLLAIVDRWLAVLPTERIVVVTVPPAGGPQDLLWRRFSSACDLDTSGFSLDVDRPNESLGGAQVELLRRVNLALGDRLPTSEGYALVRRLVAHELLATQNDHLPLALDSPTHEWASILSSRWRQGLLDRGVRIEGDVDDLLPGSWQALPDDLAVSEASINEASVDVIAALLTQWEDRVGVPRRVGVGGARRRGS